MKLEDLAKPLDIADDLLHREYSKLTKKWEDKERSKYTLSMDLDYLGLVAHSFGTIFTLSNNLEVNQVYLGLLLASPHILPSGLLSRIGLIHGEHPTGVKEENGKKIVDNKFFYFIDSFWKTMRTPELMIGIGLIGKGVFDLFNYDNSSLVIESFGEISLGTSLISNASAWFIRDSDPKVLDRKPSWKQEFEKLSNKVREYLPQPIPEEVKINHSPLTS